MNRVLLATILILGLIFKFYHLSDRYTFEWDQSDDATKVQEMITEHKPRLIGPRVANDSGFFVGPFHYYFLIPFYILTAGHPIAGAYASIFVWFVSTIVVFLIVENLFNYKVAFISVLLLSLNQNITSWNVMYTPILSIIIFYFCHKIIKGELNTLPLLIFTYSFAFNTHLVPISLGVPILIALLLSNKLPTVKQISLSVIFFLVPLIPLIIFDLRHNFINLNSLYNFIFQPKTALNLPRTLFLRTFWRSINIIYLNSNILLIITKILFIIITIFELIKIKDKKNKIFYISWIITPLILLGLYKGNIPEYYYGPVNLILPIFIGLFLNRYLNKTYSFVIFALYLLLQSRQLFLPISGLTLNNKINVVKYLVNQQKDKIFNVSYDLPYGWNTGYDYLFKYLGKNPQNIPEGHLYTIYTLNDTKPTGEVVYQDNILGLVRK